MVRSGAAHRRGVNGRDPLDSPRAPRYAPWMSPLLRPRSAALFVGALAALGACAPSGALPVQTPTPHHALLSEMAHEAKAVVSSPPSGRTTPLGPEASPISFERMSRYPEPGWHVPRALAWAPDGKMVTFLASESQTEQMALFGLDVATGATAVLLRASDLQKETKALSREEELRRERQRSRLEGVTSYRWAKRANVMVVPHGGDLFVRKADGVLARLTSTKDAELDPKLCDGGERVGFARGAELYSIDVASGKETALTRGAPAGVTRGQSDFNGQEEFEEESGFWWAPGCDKLAFLEVDERKVAEVPVVGYRARHADLMMQRYPAAGQANPLVRAGFVDVATRKTTWLSFEPGERYLGRFHWQKDGKALYFEALSRDQKRLSLMRADPATGKVSEVFAETSPTWIELSDFALLEKSPRVLWVSGTAAHQHLELRELATGAVLAPLTSGEWDVTELAGIDEEGGAALVLGTKDGPLDRHLYRVPLAGGEMKRLTPEAGVHAITLDRQAQSFIDLHSAANRLPQAVVRGPDGAVGASLPMSADADLTSLGIRPPEFVHVKSASGEPLYGALLRPRALEPGRSYPAVVVVYGGPGVQEVLNRWSPRLFWQHLADRGFVVFQLDNRGSSGRGPRFERAIHAHLGDVELADQLAGVDYLESLPFVERGRVAIYGHSYGGFMAALAMLKAPTRFKVGISGSPVTDWALYDTGYTERYMGTPESNQGGYAASDLTRLVPQLTGKLFLLHALMDENVHFQNSAELIDALIAANKDFDLLVFPGERHGYRSPKAKQYAYRRVVDYLVQNL